MPTRQQIADRTYRSLSIVHVRGFKGPIVKTPAYLDLPETRDGTNETGSANELVTHYGIFPEAEPNPRLNGIIDVDYDSDRPNEFTILIDTDETGLFTVEALSLGYTIVETEEIDSPRWYGDSSGRVAIIHTPDGWTVI